jgi:UDP-N-acetylglucosamine:LPS N-acetylglucosamine transferase
MSDIVDTGVAVPVALCGTNERLRAQLTRRGFGPALGWVDQMGALLRACDVVVQNAGGLTSLQALAAGVPVVSYRCIAGHGVTNAEALERAGYARWARHRSALGPALAAALAGPAPAVVAGAEPAEVITSLVRLPVRA